MGSHLTRTPGRPWWLPPVQPRQSARSWHRCLPMRPSSATLIEGPRALQMYPSFCERWAGTRAPPILPERFSRQIWGAAVDLSQPRERKRERRRPVRTSKLCPPCLAISDSRIRHLSCVRQPGHTHSKIYGVAKGHTAGDPKTMSPLANDAPDLIYVKGLFGENTSLIARGIDHERPATSARCCR